MIKDLGIYLVLITSVFLACSPKTSIRKSTESVDDKLSFGRISVDEIDRMLSYRLRRPTDSMDKFGFINVSGEVVIESIFDRCTDFFGNYANIIQDSIFGYVSQEGAVKLFPQYDEVYWYYNDVGYAKLSDKYGLVNRDGTLITDIEFDNIALSNSNYFKVKIQNKWRVIDEHGNYVFSEEIEFDHSIVYKGVTTYIENTEKGKKYGLISVDGDVLVEAKYDKLSSEFKNGLLRVVNEGKVGFIDKDGVGIIPIEYDDLGYEFSEGLIPANSSGKWGFIDLANRVAIDFVYDDVNSFSEGLALVKVNDKIGYIDNHGNVVIPIELPLTKSWTGNFSQGLAVFNNGSGKYGYISRRGNVAIQPIFDTAHDFKNGMAYVKLDGKIGFISKSGEPIIKIEFNQLWPPRNGMLRFSK